MSHFCHWPALYSVLFSLAASYALVHYETAIGAKIQTFSMSQSMLILFVICIVAKNVFVPSRAHRFVKPPNVSSQAQKLDKAKLKKLA